MLEGFFARMMHSIRMSLNASISSRFPILTLPFGARFLHLWTFGALLSVQPLAHPRAEGIANFPLFTWRYKPKRGDVVFDLGCGIGTELAAFSKAVGRKGLVVAVDASQDCCEMARGLIKILNLKNVIVENFAIGSENGEVSFPISGTELNNRVSSLGADLTPVQQVTIESLMIRHSITTVDLLKMNIEGSEGAALVGLPHQAIRNMAISCHDFTGDPTQRTFLKVWQWAEKNSLDPRVNPFSNPNSCEGNYIYTSRIDTSK